jgi:hypothetical protein
MKEGKDDVKEGRMDIKDRTKEDEGRKEGTKVPKRSGCLPPYSLLPRGLLPKGGSETGPRRLFSILYGL